MSDRVAYVCYPELEQDLCPRCIRSGAEFVRLEDDKFCCAWDITQLDGGITGVYQNVTECPLFPRANDDGLHFGWTWAVPLAIGAVAAGGVYVAGRWLWRRISRFYSPNSQRRREDYELASLFNTNIPQRQPEETSSAKAAAQLLNRSTFAADDEKSAILSLPKKAYGSKTQGTTIANPVYDLLYQSGTDGHAVTAELPQLPPRQENGLKNQRRKVQFSTGKNRAVVPSGSKTRPALHSLSVISEDEVAEEERILGQLLAWGNGSKVRFSRKRNDSNTSSEWETNVEL